MVVQSLAAVLAIFMAQLLHPLIQSFAETTGSVLLVFVAVKMMTDARKVKNEERTFVVEDQQILMALSLASSFNILLAFLGLGLLGIAYSPSIYVLLGAIFIISQFGIFVGSHYQPIRLGRFSKFAAGLLILVLTVIYYFS